MNAKLAFVLMAACTLPSWHRPDAVRAAAEPVVQVTSADPGREVHFVLSGGHAALSLPATGPADRVELDTPASLSVRPEVPFQATFNSVGGPRLRVTVSSGANADPQLLAQGRSITLARANPHGELAISATN